MRSKPINEAARWTGIVLSGGLGLYVAGNVLVQAAGLKSDPFVEYFITALTLVIVCGPLWLTSYACWRREYASVIEMWATIAGIIVAGLGFQIVHYCDPIKWVQWAAAPSARSDSWTMLGGILALVTASLVFLSPFLLGRTVYRFCTRLGYRHFPYQPPKWLRYVG